MANFDLSPTSRKEEEVFHECKWHTDIGFQETDRRATGRNQIGTISFDEADELFRSWIDENNWPYDALLFDPRIFTFIFEKTSRLISNKPKGRLTPREGSDVLSAKINNALLDYQWDMSNNGGTMLEKWAMMDMNARKYGASFALAKWRYECDTNGKVVFDGPDMKVLNNRDIAHELSATSIQSCNWFQVREYPVFQDLQQVNDQSRSKPIYKNLDKLREAIGRGSTEGGGGDTREVNWSSRSRQIAKLETDPIGKDQVFKNIEIITEYRKDRWITFAPQHGVVIRDIENPYKNYELPIIMLRYYAIDDDLYGLSEIEPVKGLQKAINAILCQYVDEINQQLYSPIAIGPGVRQHTLEWGKGARWIMNNPVTDFRIVESRSNAAQYFNNTYSVLVAAMMNALGESSLGISNIQPMQNDKTATEVKALQVQRNARDQFNQNFLAEAIKRQLMLWHSMNQVLLFSDPKQQRHIIRIVGKDAMDWFTEQGLADVGIDDDQIELLRSMELTPDQIEEFGKDTGFPIFPVNLGTKEKPEIVSKLQLQEKGKSASLYIEPDDIKGMFDFSVDVQSMASSSDEEMKNGRQTAVTLLASNPNVLMFLQQEGVKPKFKELFVTWLEDLGFSDAEKFFEKSQDQQAPTAPEGGMPPGMGGGDLAAIAEKAMAEGKAKREQGGDPQINANNPDTQRNMYQNAGPIGGAGTQAAAGGQFA